MNRLHHRRRLTAVALLPALLSGIAGCRHRNKAAYYPPPPSVTSTARGVGAERSARRDERSEDRGSQGTRSASAGTTASIPQPDVPLGRPILVEVGLASWYAPPYANAKAADGSIYDQNAMTAANRTLPMGSIVRVTNLADNRSVVVRITDRGPFVGERIIDLSLVAAKAIGVYRMGVAKVRLVAYAPPDRPGVDPAGKWGVQIGAFAHEPDAVRLKKELLRRYATANVTEFAGATGHWVRIYPRNSDESTARRIADSIHVRGPGVQPYLVRRN